MAFRIRRNASIIANTINSRGFIGLANRTFFASSTDHTTLLKESQVHRIQQSDNVTTLYVMAANGVETENVQKIPQLHLARIYFDNATFTMYSAKVVNRTLGTPVHVCGKLVDAILQDHRKGENVIRAKSTMHGLCDFVLHTIQQQALQNSLLQGLSPTDLESIELIARGKNKTYNENDRYKEIWEKFAIEFVQQCHDGSHECELYQSKGGKLNEILHCADTSEYADTSSGAMALFQF